MAALNEIALLNKQLATKIQSPTALFTGATNGIGLATLQAFVKHSSRPTAYIVGRSRERFASQLHALSTLNAEAEINFIEADLSLISGVDRISDHLAQHCPARSLQYICMSQGYAPLGARRFNAEGLDEAMTLCVFGRIRLIDRLISSNLLAPAARIMCVLAGAKEGKLFKDDLELKDNYSIMNLRGHFSSLMTLALDKLAEQNPGFGLVHVFPGTVNTGMRKRIPNASIALRALMYVTSPLLYFNAMSPQESGERTLSLFFDPKFDRGSFSIDYDGTLSASEELASYRADPEVADAVRNHLNELFKRAQASVSVP